jgi:hypothetical protein
VQAVERALRLGLPAEPDPRRASFYEADVEGYRYYFCIRQPSRVLLIFRWRAR